MSSLTFYPIADSFLLVFAVGALLTGLLALAPRGGRARGWRRWALAGLRAAVIVLVLLAMLRPTIVYTETRKQSATLVVMVDDSRSMSVRDAVAGRSRWESLQQALGDAAPALAKLAEDFELKVYGFDGQTRTLQVRGGRVVLPEKPDGPQTAIGAGLEDVLRREAGKRLLGVILLSDGAQRALAPRDLAPQTAAAQLKLLGTPLYTVPFGQSRGLGQAQDVAVTKLLAPESVFVNVDLTVDGELRIDGYVNQKIPVRLLFETSPGKMERVAEKELQAATSGELLPLRLDYVPKTTGEFKLTLEAAEQPGELVTTNNQLSTFVTVRSGGLRVLYLEGALRVESKFLRRSLDASPDISLDYVRIDPRDPATRPGDLAERLDPGKYEVYILGDLDASVFRGDELERLATAVDRGAGLIMLGGFHSFGPGGYAETPLARVLPVEMNRLERQSLDGAISPDLHVPGPLQMRPTAVGLLHFALMLAGNREENLALWSKLPPLEGANKFRRFSPGALVLAEGVDPTAPSKVAPLLAAQDYGNGRVMAFAADSTWHWWMRGYEAMHKRFWRQVVLWLARKDDTAEGNVWIKLAKRRYGPAERVEFTAGAQAATGEPVAGAEYQIEVVLPDGSRQTVRPVRQGEEVAGSFRDTLMPGDYAIELKATHEGQMLGAARSRFLVYQQDLELDNAAADSASLDSLAAMTGGRSIVPEQLSELIEQLSRETAALEVARETKMTFWDTWPFFLAVVGLLGVEWYLRKRWGLV